MIIMKAFTSYRVAAEHAGLTVENYLKSIHQYSGRRLQKLTRRKGIILKGKSVYLQKKLHRGDLLQVLILEEDTSRLQPEKGPVEILYEDDFLLVLNKPAFMLVHPTGRTTKGTLANYLAHHLQERGQGGTIRPVHRLDRETSGCVIFAKDARSQFLLEQQLKEKTLRRTYWALVKGVVTPPAGTIEAPIGPHPTQANRRAVQAQGQPAITHYRTIRNLGENSLLELTLATGRTHQIRVHLAHLGYPILGDSMYGIRVPWLSRQALHASRVSFHHLQDNREISVDAPLPADLTRALELCERQ